MLHAIDVNDLVILVLAQLLKIELFSVLVLTSFYPSFVLFVSVLVFAVRTRLRCPGFFAMLGVLGILSPSSVD